jgi:hypothetical protein
MLGECRQVHVLDQLGHLDYLGTDIRCLLRYEPSPRPQVFVLLVVSGINV